MTATAAQRKLIVEPAAEASPKSHVNRMWIDPAHLPTTLAQHGKKRELAPLQPWSSIKREHPTNRILDYADIALGIKENRRAADRKIKIAAVKFGQ